MYPSIPSSIAPANHGPELPIPQYPTTHALSSTSSEDNDAHFEVGIQCSSKDSHFPNQNKLNDLTRDLALTKTKAVTSSKLLQASYFTGRILIVFYFCCHKDIFFSSQGMEFASSFVQDLQAKKTACDLCKFLCNVL